MKTIPITEGKVRKGGLNKEPNCERPPLPALTGENRFKTEMEKKLWGMLYKSQMALAIMCLDEMNRTRENKNDWPAGQEWVDCVGSSHAIFCRVARKKANIDDQEYLDILRNNEDAMDIAGPIYDKLHKTGEF